MRSRMFCVYVNIMSFIWIPR